MAKQHCPYCGASMVKYKRNFSKDLARCMYRLANAGGDRVDIASLKLTNAQYSNIQRIKFWGLIQREENADGSGRGGIWSITEQGWAFVKGKVMIPKYVFTYRNETIERGDEMISIQDVTEGWWYKPKVVEESRPHGPTV